ncbi:MAG: hypothetical protein IJQ82_02275 [Selenomonadaceae bacterium]|nr:hypothetical protein [Selenomonadaceae bacterium]
MKIIKSGNVIATLRDEPKDFEGGCKGGIVWVVVGDDDVKLARYSTNERAYEVQRSLSDAYFNGDEEFVLPEE